MSMSRRSLLGIASMAPLAVLWAANARAQGGAACYDPATLPLSQRNRRRAIGYLEVSNQAGKACATCAFFAAGGPAGCGTCQMLSGGQVNARALCDSFAAKAG